MATIQPGYAAAGYSLASGNSGSTSQSSTNFSAGGEAALAALIQQLLNGGTTEQKQNRTQRNEEIASVRGIRNDYSKADAMNDANLVIRKQQREALEELLPSLVRSAEGAGTSKNAMRALMVQQAATQAAESAAALGLKASVDYGNISANLSGVLENLTKSDNPVTNALLSAINLSKGQSSSSQTTTGNNSSGGYTRTGTPSDLPMVRGNGSWTRDLIPTIDRSDKAVYGTNNLMTASVGEGGWVADNARSNTSRAGISDSVYMGQSNFFDGLTF
jgi:hypothetical protein